MARFNKQNPQIAGELNEAQTARALTQAQAIAEAAEAGAVRKNQFVFFAAFDGTRNDKGDVELSRKKHGVRSFIIAFHYYLIAHDSRQFY